MTSAYDEAYLGKARTVLARMLDFAVYDLKYDIEKFFQLFIFSGVANLFESGDCRTLVGMSGVELAYEVLERAEIEHQRVEPQFTINRSEEYWAGWALAYYQWFTALSFVEIMRFASIKDVVNLYSPFHEMDIQQFVDRMNEMRDMSTEAGA